MATKTRTTPAPVRKLHPKGLPPLKVDHGVIGSADGIQIVGIGIEGTKDYDYYRVTPVAADVGPAFCVEKLTGDTSGGPYDVSLHGHGHCDCRGFSRYGICRHTRALFLLWSRNQLDTHFHARGILARQDEAANLATYEASKTA